MSSTRQDRSQVNGVHASARALHSVRKLSSGVAGVVQRRLRGRALSAGGVPREKCTSGQERDAGTDFGRNCWLLMLCCGHYLLTQLSLLLCCYHFLNSARDDAFTQQAKALRVLYESGEGGGGGGGAP